MDRLAYQNWLAYQNFLGGYMYNVDDQIFLAVGLCLLALCMHLELHYNTLIHVQFLQNEHQMIVFLSTES